MIGSVWRGALVHAREQARSDPPERRVEHEPGVGRVVVGDEHDRLRRRRSPASASTFQLGRWGSARLNQRRPWPTSSQTRPRQRRRRAPARLRGREPRRRASPGRAAQQVREARAATSSRRGRAPARSTGSQPRSRRRSAISSAARCSPVGGRRAGERRELVDQLPPARALLMLAAPIAQKVELVGLEPTTFALPARRSPS